MDWKASKDDLTVLEKKVLGLSFLREEKKMRLKIRKFRNWIVAGALLGVLGIGFYIFYIVVTFQKEILDNQQQRFPQMLESPDGVYTLCAFVAEDFEMDIHYVNIAIVENATKEEVFKVENIYRMYDFHWVAWENISDNFWIKSGDLGTFCYKYQENGRWEKYVLRAENGKYWLFQDGGSGENINLEELAQRLQEDA